MENKKVLITGGSGFLGRNLAKKLKEIGYTVYLSSRNNKNNFVAKKITGCEVIPCDVSNIESVRDLFREVNPNIVIHAAATKFVDLSEKFPMETIDVNIVGSQNIARVSIENNVDVVIGISTDKACPPIRNIYGLSKASMERSFCLMNGKTNTKFTCVRYGNVAWSTGSVLPVWKEMFESTKKIQSTGPEMRRFFFSIKDAVNLVITALNNIEELQGKILSREMKSCQIQDILRVWTSNFGGSWEKINGRPGERDDEYLVGETELSYCEVKFFEAIKHFIISPNNKVESPLNSVFHSGNCERLTDEEILDILNSEKDNV
jgi:UDP-glucose 4-epimerase